MTTLLYNHNKKEIAIDSRLTASGQIMSDSAVKWRTASNGAVWFYSGQPVDMDAAMLIFDSAMKTNKMPSGKNPIEFGAIIAFEGSAYFCYHTSSGEYIMEDATHNDGFGSGGIYGLCALNLGKSSLEAVEFSKTMDAYSGGKARVYSVQKMGFISKSLGLDKVSQKTGFN